MVFRFGQQIVRDAVQHERRDEQTPLLLKTERESAKKNQKTTKKTKFERKEIRAK